MLVSVIFAVVVGLAYLNSLRGGMLRGDGPAGESDGWSASSDISAIEDVEKGNEAFELLPALIHKGSNDVEVLFLPEESGESNCYLVVDRQSMLAAVIDPACRNCIELHEYLLGRRLNLVYILITHAHRDHLSGLDCFLVRTTAKVVVHRLEVGRFPISCRPTSERGTFTAEDRFLYCVDEQDIEFGGVRLRAKMIPGHTVASLAFLLIGEDVVFSGDTLFRGSIGRTDLPGATGQADLISNITNKLMSLDDHTIILPGHGAFTTVGQERAMNQFLGVAK